MTWFPRTALPFDFSSLLPVPQDKILFPFDRKKIWANQSLRHASFLRWHRRREPAVPPPSVRLSGMSIATRSASTILRLLVTRETDPVAPTHKVYDYIAPVPSIPSAQGSRGRSLDYDPHLDPQLVPKAAVRVRLVPGSTFCSFTGWVSQGWKISVNTPRIRSWYELAPSRPGAIAASSETVSARFSRGTRPWPTLC